MKKSTMKTLTMKTLSKAVAASVLMLAGSQAISYELGAGFEASANVGVVSNYMWRGMTQTRNGAAVQGGLDLTHSSGFYAGTWMSNVDFKFFPGAIQNRISMPVTVSQWVILLLI
jgi:uncharacterized protein (TIGR02001 family)